MHRHARSHQAVSITHTPSNVFHQRLNGKRVTINQSTVERFMNRSGYNLKACSSRNYQHDAEQASLLLLLSKERGNTCIPAVGSLCSQHAASEYRRLAGVGLRAGMARVTMSVVVKVY